MNILEETNNYIENIKSQLEALELYIPGDDETMLKDLGRQYYQYLKNLDLSQNSLNSKDANTYGVISNRHYQNVLNTIKFLGIVPMNRVKLKVLETTNPGEESIIDKLETFLLEDNLED